MFLEMELRSSWLERPRHGDTRLGQCHHVHVPHQLNNPGQPHSSLHGLGAGKERKLRGAFFSIIHAKISADAARALRGWLLMEPADVSGQ